MTHRPLVRKNAVLLVAVFVVIGFFIPAPRAILGTNCQSIAGQPATCVYSAQTNYSSIVLTVVVLLLWRFTRIQASEDLDKPVAVYQRIVAFFIDMFIVMMGVVTVIVLSALSLEWLITGVWNWQVIRSETSPIDWIFSLLGIVAFFWMMVRVLSQCARAGRPTFGQLVAGYRVTKGDDVIRPPQYVARVFYAIFGLCMWPISLYKALRNERRDFWWDTATNTKVVRAEAVRW